MSVEHRTRVGDPTGQRTNVVLWFGVVVFGRLYTVLLCDAPGRIFGVDGLCYTWFHGIPSYLWIELVLYGPVMWFALHQVGADVFGDAFSDPDGHQHRRRLHVVAMFATAMYVYGVGIHAADVLEVISRERAGITDGVVYEVAYFLDEGLSHYVQFVSIFFLVGWFILFDRPGRTSHQLVAVLYGIAHGVERGLGTIEGEKWFLGAAVIAWIGGTVWLRRRHVGSTAFEEFFVRYAIAFLITLPICQAAYYVRFGAFPPPSELADRDYAQVVAGAFGLTAVGAGLAMVLDHRRRSPGS